ncbi:MAG: hypothetical protein Ct9H90mP15_08740 [Candidatus Neomarinimicrobiota bacterium]|nr:MAG: hypothetical protein Ct9H90mP15_08740 [Candidatus Neomarinimicrobiota bacterium]
MKPILAGLSTGMIVYLVKPYIFESGYFDYHSSILYLVIYLLFGAIFILLILYGINMDIELDDEDKDIVQVITNKLLNK